MADNSPVESTDLLADDRREYIGSRVRQHLEKLAQDAVYWSKTPPAAFEVEPLWYELRDAIVSELFEMDRVQHELEKHAEDVVRDAL